jgi:hypothetical protein
MRTGNAYVAIGTGRTRETAGSESTRFENICLSTARSLDVDCPQTNDVAATAATSF